MKKWKATKINTQSGTSGEVRLTENISFMGVKANRRKYTNGGKVIKPKITFFLLLITTEPAAGLEPAT